MRIRVDVHDRMQRGYVYYGTEPPGNFAPDLTGSRERGWFQWYCRYYMGRRTADDRRQIRR